MIKNRPDFVQALAWILCFACCNFVFSGCTRPDPVDPEEMSFQAGRRAKIFYEHISLFQLPEAVVFFSHSQRKQYPDPLNEPLLASRALNDFEQAFPRLDHVDWKKGVVYFRVDLRVAQKKEKDMPRNLDIVASRLDEWVKEDGEWYYNGGRLRQ